MLARMSPPPHRSTIAELLSNHPDDTTYDPYVQRSTDRPAHVRTNPEYGVTRFIERGEDTGW